MRLPVINGCSRQAGLSLLETTVLLLVVSLLLLPLLELLRLRQIADRYDLTQGNLNAVASALHQHVLRNGRYPRPAPRNLSDGDSGFGQETALTLATIPACVGNDAGPCSTLRTRAGLPPALILIGDIPFATLGLDAPFVVDGWGGKITYAVTAALTETVLFDDNGGAIRVVDASGSDHDGTSGNAHFVLVSHGENQRGAFSIGGTQIASCTAGGVTRADTDNCNNDGVFNSNSSEHITPFGIGYDREQNLVEGANYYDDFVRFALATPGDNWGRSLADTSIPDVFKRSRGRVRVGAVPVGGDAALRTPVAMVEVMGNAAADRLLTPRICPYPTNRASPQLGCTPVSATAGAGLVSPQYLPGVFTPSVIGGVVSPDNAGKSGGGIDCGGLGVTGISVADEECSLAEVANVSLLSGLLTACTPDPGTGISRYPRGVNADGTLICERP